MKDDNAKRLRANRVWLSEASCDLDAFGGSSSARSTAPTIPSPATSCRTCSSTTAVEARSAAASPEARKELMAEWVEALTDGPGIIAIRDAFADMTPIDTTNDHFWAIIEDERRTTSAAAIISPSRAPTTASGTRSRSSACAIRPHSPPITATRSSRW